MITVVSVAPTSIGNGTELNFTDMGEVLLTDGFSVVQVYCSTWHSLLVISLSKVVNGCIKYILELGVFVFFGKVQLTDGISVVHVIFNMWHSL